MTQKRKIIICGIGVVICACILLGRLVYNSHTKRQPIFSATYYYDDWSNTETIILNDLHENDLVTYRISHMDGWIDVWLENAEGEPVTKGSTSGTTEFALSERGLYVLQVKGEHANASVILSVYRAE